MPLTPDYLIHVVLIFVRIGGMLMAAPFFSQRFIPIRVKVFFALLLAYALSGLVPVALPPNATTTIGLAMAVAIEAVTGLLLGFAGQLTFWAVQLAGEVIGFQVGLSMAQAFDPGSEAGTNPVGRFLTLVFTLVFLLLDGHHYILRAIMASFEVVPLAGAGVAEGGPILLSWTGKFLASALRLAAPFMVTIFLVDTALAVFARVAPQTDLFSIGIPLKLFLGLGLTYLFMQHFLPAIPGMVQIMLDDLLYLIEVLAPADPDSHVAERDDKQFDPTPHRLQKAREEGNVFRSREIVSVALLMTGGGLLALGTPPAVRALQGVMERIFLQASTTELTVRSVPAILQDIGFEVTLMMAPLFGILVITGFALNVMQSGLNISVKPLAPKGSRINPVEGLKRVFSKKGLFEFLKAVLKVALVMPLAYSAIKGHLPDILTLHTLDLTDAMETTGGWIIALVFQLTLGFLALSVIDFVVEKRRYINDLKMSRQEIQDEAKEQEGDPQVKGRRRQIARDRLRRPRLDHAILKADVVVTNPTHYAVALRYDPSEADAPTVVAKGIRKRALRIKELATTHRIPTIENRPLARALYASVDEGQQIPEELYPAVAAILAEVFRQRGRM